MKIFEIYNIINEIAPFSLQESWDNSGLIIGSLNSDVERVYLSLDIDSALIDEILPNSLIITHHPLIFKGLKSLNFNLYPSSLISKMITKNISLISAHTNYDRAVLNEYFVCEILGFKVSFKDDFLIYCDVEFSFDELVKFLKQKMNLQNLRAVFAKEQIKRVAVCTGSGGDLIKNINADAFISGDIKYHQALEAKENNLNLFDVGHYESEQYFGVSAKKYLQNFPIPIIITSFKNPFTHH